MLSESRDFLYVAWWLAAFPGAALALTVLGINLRRGQLDRLAAARRREGLDVRGEGGAQVGRTERSPTTNTRNIIR